MLFPCEEQQLGDAHAWTAPGGCASAQSEVLSLLGEPEAQGAQEAVAPEQELTDASDDGDGSSVSGNGLTLCLQDDAAASARLESLLVRLHALVPSGVDSTREEAYSRYALVYGDCDGYMDSMDAMLTKLENRPRLY